MSYKNEQITEDEIKILLLYVIGIFILGNLCLIPFTLANTELVCPQLIGSK
jgi:hypothetical protein